MKINFLRTDFSLTCRPFIPDLINPYDCILDPEGETDFFRSGLARFESGIGEGLEESVYFCACHLGWEGVITV